MLSGELKTMRRHLMAQLLLLCAILLNGCVLGPGSLRNSRLNYNRAVQQTSREELLLNLVRMRYHESEEFLGVSSITGQYTYDADLGTSGSWKEATPTTLGAAFGLGMQSKPTIVYAPEQGKDFNQRKLTPVSLETLDLLTSKGWAIDRVLRVAIRNINDVDNATSAGGPTPSRKPEFEEYLYLTKLMRELQLDQHSLEVSLESRVTGDSSPISKSIPLDHLELDGSDIVLAAEKGYEFHVSEDQKTAELWKSEKKTTVPVLRIAQNAKDSPQVSEIYRILELVPDLPSYRIKLDGEGGQLTVPNSRRLQGIDPEVPFPVTLRDEITMSTRSIKEMMFYLSHSVRVPQEHFNCGYVRATYDAFGNPFDWNEMTEGLFQVCCSKRKPKEAAVAVKHRGYWFYILDSDLDSKSTFNLLLELINLEIRAGGGAQIPFLTI